MVWICSNRWWLIERGINYMKGNWILVWAFNLIKHIYIFCYCIRVVRELERMKVAVVGGGISGLVSAYVLAKAGVEVSVFEKEACLDAHSKTINFHGFDLDLAFMLFNRVNSLSLSQLHLHYYSYY